MTDHESRPPRDDRESETKTLLARSAMYRELDRALDEVRLGLAVDAWGRSGSRSSARRDLERS